ncbi:Trimeric GatFAB AmidoTransferase(AdT) complex subunit [Tulasnella sp. 419]|nr:Trimeric GatFAB AmidoTransferase(AdT) complex subunit [Tulasnella sp. 419]
MLQRSTLHVQRCNTIRFRFIHDRSSLVQRHAETIKKLNDGEGGIKAYVSTNFRIDETAKSGPLNDSCIAIKDNICTADLPTTCSSAFLQDFQPGYDASVVRLLRESGAHIIGKTNCDEFGMGSFNTNTIHGSVINPFQLEGTDEAQELSSDQRSAGGSSGGSAAAVAASMCTSAIGTDTGGSIRLPASYCGIVGFKPSYGLVSRWGVISYADSLDCVGVLARSVPETRRVFASAEASSNLARYDGIRFGRFVEPPMGADLSKTSNVYAFSRSKGFGPEVRRRILLGTYALTAGAFDNYFLKAQRIRTALRADFDRIFRQPNVLGSNDPSGLDENPQGVDFLLHLSAIGTAVPLDHTPAGIDGYVQDVLTVPASLGGLPALNVPAGKGHDGWPVGVSIIGQWGSDDAVLSFGEVINKFTSS